MPKAKRIARNSSETTAAAAAPEANQPSERMARRVPFGGMQRRLEVIGLDPNYHYYWQKDTGDNIPRMKQGGYVFVSQQELDSYSAGKEILANLEDRGGNESLTDKIERYGGIDVHGGEYNLVLMKLLMKYHLEDKAEAEKRNAQTDQAIFRQQFPADPGDNTGRYGDINVTVNHEE